MYSEYSPPLSAPPRSQYQNPPGYVKPVPLNIGLDATQLDKSADTFKVLLGMEYVLYVKTQSFHWNVTGMSFVGLHQLFGEQYQKLAKYIDEIAEQIRQYGEVAPGSTVEFLQLNSAGNGEGETPGELSGQVIMLNALLRSHEAIARYIQAVDETKLDLASQDLLGKLYDFHTKAAWMLRAHLQ